MLISSLKKSYLKKGVKMITMLATSAQEIIVALIVCIVFGYLMELGEEKKEIKQEKRTK